MYNSLAREYFLKIVFSAEISTTKKKMDVRVTPTVSLDMVHLLKKKKKSKEFVLLFHVP